MSYSLLILAVCTSMFALRVLGQLLVVLRSPRWLPANEHWYSGLMPYRYLLPSQLALLAVMVVITLDVSRGRGLFAADLWAGVAPYLAVLSWIYFGAMCRALHSDDGPSPRFEVVQKDDSHLVPHGPGACALGLRRLSLGMTARDEPPYPPGIDADIVETSPPRHSCGQRNTGQGEWRSGPCPCGRRIRTRP